MSLNLNHEKAFSKQRKSWGEYYDILKDGQKKFQPFYRQMIQDVLCNEKNDAPVCSPACMTLWLAALAEMSSARTRKQILDAMGMKDTTSLSQTVDAMWELETRDEEEGICRLSSSIWLNQNRRCSEKKALEKQFRMSHMDIFAGEMGSDSMNREIKNWLNECTGGKLKDQVSDISLSPEIQAVLFSAIYFKAGWEMIEFSEPREAVFHGENRKGKCQMMKGKETLPYYRGDQFGAVSLDLTGLGRQIFFILPDESSSINAVLKSSSFDELLEQGEEYPDREMAKIQLYLPQIKADAKINLIPYLEKEGIQDAFDYKTADFSPLLELGNLPGPLYLSKADHCVHIEWDERGVEGAAYTMGQYDCYGLPPSALGKITFRLDRPFIYLIMGIHGTPLFVGAVRNI